MAQLRTEGIIIKRKDFRETDLTVTLFSRDFGKIVGIAFGARRSNRRFTNCLSLFALSTIFFSQRPNENLVRLDSCELQKGRTHITENLNTLAHASYLAELTGYLTADRDKNPGIFELLESCLELLDENVPPEGVSRIFEIRFLTFLGYQLDLHLCPGCMRSLNEVGTSYFQIAEGRFRCESCALDRSLPLSEGTLKTLTFAQNEPLKSVGRLRIPRGTEQEARRILESFLVHLMQKRPKSLDFITQLREKK